ncbi:hypothetical protein ACOBQX_13770 [Actinokineospora sp. G85]|uniref:hypothetical protein n=1 Tax=Actinokineospora sp. G85 TaxID=3406626 RepID=UPI003C70D32D
MPPPILILIVGAVGACLLSAFYSVVKVRWPANYYSSSDLVDEAVSQSPLRYAVFRCAPPYVIGVLAATTAMRYGISFSWTLTVLFALHAALTSGRSIVASHYRGTLRLNQVVMDVVVALIAAIALWLAERSARWWLPLMPGPDKYVEVLLTGVVVAVIVHQLQKMTSYNENSSAGRAAEQLAHLPAELREHTLREAARHQVDFDLALAILATEAAQRPKWFRRAERAVPGARTFGVMQYSTDRFDSDKESITEAMHNLAGASLKRTNSWIPSAQVEYQLERHNSSTSFVEFASTVFQYLHTSNCSATVGSDGNPRIRVTAVQRVGDHWSITVDASPDVVLICIVHGHPDTVHNPNAGVVGELRRSVEFTTSIMNTSVNIAALGAVPSGADDEDLSSLLVDTYRINLG